MPDIEWHITDRSEQVVSTSRRKPPRRRWAAVLLVIVIGIGLGLAYRSIPELVSRPTPSPPPTPQPTHTYPAIPAKLYATIDREAQALADGDMQAYLALHVYEDPFWTQQFTSTFQAWQRPADGQPLYTIIDFNQRTATTASVDIRQFRNGRSFRETRFYVWEKDRWLRREIDPSFWSSRTETYDTSHFRVIYFVEDRYFIQPVINQLEQALANLCIDVGCDAIPLTYTLSFNSYSTSSLTFSLDEREIRSASPRVMGVYEDGAPLGREGLNLIWTLAWTTVLQRAYGQQSVADYRASYLLLWAISRWATMRAAEQPDTDWLSKVKTELQNRSWSWQELWSDTPPNDYEAVYGQANAVIHFIEYEYGPRSMPKLVKALGTAQSFADAIKQGLGVPFAEFEQKWQAWLESYTP